MDKDKDEDKDKDKDKEDGEGIAATLGREDFVSCAPMARLSCLRTAGRRTSMY